MLLNGRPLCDYLLRTLVDVPGIDERYVYCSDEAIIPYLPEGVLFLKRDEVLDGFEIKGLDIIEHFVHDVDADIYVLSHVTQPFTKAQSISRALKKVVSGEYDSAFSAIELQDYFWTEGQPLNYDPADIPRTQDLEPVYMETGSFFIFRKEVFTSMHRRIGSCPFICPIDQFEAVDIDTAKDFDFAQAVALYLSSSIQGGLR